MTLLRGFAVTMLIALAVCLAAVQSAVVAAQSAGSTAPVATATPAAAAWETIEDVWYCLELGGERCGYSRVQTEHQRAPASAGGELWRTSNETVMRIGRAAAAIEIRMGWVFLEDSVGNPISCEATQLTGATLLRSEYVWNKSGVTVTSIQGDRRTERQLPAIEGSYLAPHAMDVAGEARRKAGEKSITLRGLDPSNGISPITVTSEWEAREEIDSCNGRVMTDRWRATNDIVAVPTTEWIDGEGHLLRSTTKMPFGSLDMRACPSETALSKTPGGAAPELLLSTLVKPDKPIESPRQTRRIAYRLTSVDGSPIRLASAGSQVVTTAADGALEVVVDVDTPQTASDADRLNAAFSAASPMIDSDDAMVRSLSERALKRAPPDASTRAKAGELRAFINRFIKAKNLGTAFATASETARSASGDCSEHAILLAAVLRSAGIPSRVAAGMVYADAFAGEKGIFGWHMWTQALIDGKWIDLDATLPVDFDAAHILAVTTAQESDALDPALGALVTIVGNIRVEIIDVRR